MRKVALSCFKQPPLTSNAIFALWIKVNFVARLLSNVLEAFITSDLKVTEILSLFLIHYHESIFYHQLKPNVWSLLYFFSDFICYIKHIIYLTFTCKAFFSFPIFASKLNLTNLLNSGAVIKPMVFYFLSLFFIFFVLETAVLIIPVILLSISKAFIFKATLVANTAQKMRFMINDSFCKFDQIYIQFPNWSY